jgi:hypothetical protein
VAKWGYSKHRDDDGGNDDCRTDEQRIHDVPPFLPVRNTAQAVFSVFLSVSQAGGIFRLLACHDKTQHSKNDSNYATSDH